MNTMTHIGAAIAGLLILAGCASEGGSKPNTTANQRNPACLNDTGSRVPTKNPDCSAIGRSYSSEDINRTGETDVGDALKHLDPSVTIHK